MSGIFTKLVRRVFMCQVCMRCTDVMAIDDEDARKRIRDKGWREDTVTKMDGKEVSIGTTCKRCSKLLLDAQAKKEGKDG